MQLTMKVVIVGLIPAAQQATHTPHQGKGRRGAISSGTIEAAGEGNMAAIMRGNPKAF